ncbi:WxL domain-containing protein, partial [Leuconostoc pseudomesenteroides]
PLSIAFADTTTSTSVATDVAAGSLSIDSATSSLDFGTIDLDTLATTAFSKDGNPAVVTVSDLTGTTTGWTLQGSFSGLQSADETELSGSKLT